GGAGGRLSELAWAGRHGPVRAHQSDLGRCQRRRAGHAGPAAGHLAGRPAATRCYPGRRARPLRLRRARAALRPYWTDSALAVNVLAGGSYARALAGAQAESVRPANLEGE